MSTVTCLLFIDGFPNNKDKKKSKGQKQNHQTVRQKDTNANADIDPNGEKHIE